MDKAERQKKYEEQTEQRYAAIGRFAVKFEHVCHSMHNAIIFALHSHGLTNQRLANAVLEGLTAPLRRIFGAVIAEIKADKLVGDEKKILTNVLKRIAELTESRNDVIHRMWFVGWAAETDEDFSRVGGWKFKNTSKALNFAR